MRIWIDFANSPHPLLFEPVVARLEDMGHEVVLTTRDHAQTLELTRQRWPEAHVVGGRSPANRLGKATAIYARARELARFGRDSAADVAVSHNSYAQAMAARYLGIPAITAMDYEYQPANHVAFRCAARILVPEDFPRDRLRLQGGAKRKVWRYPGFKEEIYLHQFEPDHGVLADLGLDDGEPFVVARPSPAGATYHQFGNPLFNRALELLFAIQDLKTVVLARRSDDLAGLAVPADRAIVPDRAVDSKSLICHAAALVGAGGTMNREAAILGTPAYSLYAGRLAAVDKHLITEGRMKLVSDDLSVLERDLVRPEGRPRRKPALASTRVLDRFVDAIVAPVRASAIRHRAGARAAVEAR